MILPTHACTHVLTYKHVHQHICTLTLVSEFKATPSNFREWMGTLVTPNLSLWQFTFPLKANQVSLEENMNTGSRYSLTTNSWNYLQYWLLAAQSRGKGCCMAVILFVCSFKGSVGLQTKAFGTPLWAANWWKDFLGLVSILFNFPSVNTWCSHIIFLPSTDPVTHVISGSRHHGMASPQVADGGMAFDMEGSCKYIE